MDNPKLKPALIGGVAFGIASALPYIEMINMACCALVIAAGVLGSYLYLKDQPPFAKAPYGDGALVGLLAGVVAAVASTIVGAIVMALGLKAAQTAQTLAALEQSGIELPPFVLGMMGAGGLSATAVGTMLVFNLILYAIFATLGGLVGVAIFHKKDAGT